MRILLIAANSRPQAVSLAREVQAWLHGHGHQVHMPMGLAATTGCTGCGVPDDGLTQGADLAIAIGGDGTVLQTVHLAASHHLPVLGINAGALGFLTELTPDEYPRYLPRVLEGEYTLEPRMLIRGIAYRGTQVLGEFIALNDIVVRQGAMSRLIKLRVTVAGHELGQYVSDGLIVSTPTGSTAYGLSAGGPIIYPTASAMALIPICPHSLSFRPVVIPATDAIEIACESNSYRDEMLVTADGLTPLVVCAGDRVTVQPAPEKALFVKLGLFSFYDRLREKLQWGGRA